MTGRRKDEPGQEEAKSKKRRARLCAELRANLLKRKAQTKARKPFKDRNEGRQS